MSEDGELGEVCSEEVEEKAKASSSSSPLGAGYSVLIMHSALLQKKKPHTLTKI